MFKIIIIILINYPEWLYLKFQLFWLKLKVRVAEALLKSITKE